MIKMLLKLSGVVNHEENERGWDGLYLDSLNNDYFLAYVGGPRFVNPTFYSLANFLLSVCMGVASMYRKAAPSISFQQHGPRTLHLFLRSNANRIYTFSRIGDAKFPKLTGG